MRYRLFNIINAYKAAFSLIMNNKIMNNSQGRKEGKCSPSEAVCIGGQKEVLNSVVLQTKKANKINYKFHPDFILSGFVIGCYVYYCLIK